MADRKTPIRRATAKKCGKCGTIRTELGKATFKVNDLENQLAVMTALADERERQLDRGFPTLHTAPPGAPMERMGAQMELEDDDDDAEPTEDPGPNGLMRRLDQLWGDGRQGPPPGTIWVNDLSAPDEPVPVETEETS